MLPWGVFALLREVLTAVVQDISPETADTESAGYRRELKARRDRLQHLLGLLANTLERTRACSE